MITVKQIADTNIVEIEFDGAITAEEFDHALAEVNDSIQQHGSIRVLEVVHTIDTPPIPWSKFWDDIKFGFEHLKDITHVAVVADQAWLAVYIKVLSPLLKAEIKVFKLSELEQAREWLKNAPKKSSHWVF